MSDLSQQLNVQLYNLSNWTLYCVGIFGDFLQLGRDGGCLKQGVEDLEWVVEGFGGVGEEAFGGGLPGLQWSGGGGLEWWTLWKWHLFNNLKT